MEFFFLEQTIFIIKIKRNIIRYNNKTIYKSRTYNKINKELEINIKSINFMKFRRIRKIKQFIIFKRKFSNNNNWNCFIDNDIHPSNNIFLDPIMDKIEIKFININMPNNFSSKSANQSKDIKLYLDYNKILSDVDQFNSEKFKS